MFIVPYYHIPEWIIRISTCTHFIWIVLKVKIENESMRHVYFLFTFIIAIDSVLRQENKCDILKPFMYMTESDICLSNFELYTNFDDWHLAKHPILERTFPLDKETQNFVRKVSNCLFSIVNPIPLKSNVQLAAVSGDALTEILDLDPSVAFTYDFLSFANGGKLLANPLSHRYGGHQFGSWAGQLGDGRAIMIGEYINQKGDRYELQLKGSGRTPYSRRGDGRAVIRSSVREFLCSEAMHFLGKKIYMILYFISVMCKCWP